MSEFPVSAYLNTVWPAAEVVAVSREVEAAGYDGIWLPDHMVADPGSADRPAVTMADSVALLAGVATAVPRVRLGTLVSPITFRHPAVLANAAATIDALAGGDRVVLGVGAGWMQEEHDMFGIELGAPRERVDRLEEGLAVLDGILHTPRTTVDGTHYEVTDAPRVAPADRHLPILVGTLGGKRMLGLVARWADEWNVASTPETFAEATRLLTEQCDRIGRDPRTIRRSALARLQFSEADQAPALGPVPQVGGSVEQIVDAFGRWREAGLDEFVLTAFLGGPDEARALFERFATDIRPKLDS